MTLYKGIVGNKAHHHIQDYRDVMMGVCF